MASIFKPTYIDPKTGERKKAKTWKIAYIDENGKRKIVPGFTDKQASQAKAKGLEIRAQRIKAGLPVDHTKDIREAARAYIEKLIHRGSAAEGSHVKESTRILDTLITHCKWTNIQDVRPEHLNDFFASFPKRAPRTHNRYHETLRAFLNWCIQSGWLQESPIQRMKLLKVGHAGRRRLRRAYTEDEWSKLLAVATPERKLVYTVAALSGYRRSELGKMVAADCNPEKLIWCPRAEITKSKRKEILPMLAKCAEALLPAWKGAKPTQKLLPLIPHIETLHLDMKKAGIEEKDSQGRHLDFHSFRYTFCTWMSKVLPIQKVMVLMRHRTITLTANLYLDLGLTDAAETHWTLPALPINVPGQAKQKPA